MAISTAVQKGSHVYVYDEKNHQFYVYDEKGHQTGSHHT